MVRTWLTVVCIVAFAGTAVAQGRSSEDFIRRDKMVPTSDQLKRNVVDRVKAVSSGWGAPVVRAGGGSAAKSGRGVSTPSTSTLAPVGPPRSRSASFGGGSGTGGSKPFENIVSRPTVSPYLGLFNDDIGGNDDLNYQTFVRPQLQQQQFNQQISRRTQAINQRMSAMSARNPYNTRGSENVMPTGHSATFSYYSRFYPQMSQRRQ